MLLFHLLLQRLDHFLERLDLLAQCLYFGMRIGEVSCPTRYFAEASSINFRRSVTYGIGVIETTLQCALKRLNLVRCARFDSGGRRLGDGSGDARLEIVDQTC